MNEKCEWDKGYELEIERKMQHIIKRSRIEFEGGGGWWLLLKEPNCERQNTQK